MATARRKTTRPAHEKPDEIKPLDFSILKKFNFIDGPGSYEDKIVCAMTGLHLVVEIAKGNVTLAQATGLAPMPDDKDEIGVSDHVQCVSPQLNSLIIERNDTMESEGRKAWAMKILPRVVGTNLGIAFERKLGKGLLGLEVLHLESKAEALLKKWLSQKPGKRDRNLISQAEEIVDPYTDNDEEEALAWLDYQIEWILSEVAKEKDRRAAKRAAKMQPKNTPDPSIGA